MLNTKRLRRKNTLHMVLIWVVFAIFAVYAFTLVAPFFWTLFNSFKSSEQFTTNIWSLPSPFTFVNYKTALNTSINKGGVEYNIIGMFFISVGITIAATIINLLLSAMAAYVVAKYKFFGRNILFSVALFAMILPTAGTLTAQWKLMDFFGLTDSIVGLLILYSGAFGFNFFILQGIFKNISWTYAEAAFVDGAGHFRVFFTIMLPIIRPTLVSLAIIYSIGIWNDYYTPSLYSKSVPTLAVGLRELQIQLTHTSAYPALFATMVIAMLPILILFICFQKTIMENTIAGGLKG